MIVQTRLWRVSGESTSTDHALVERRTDIVLRQIGAAAVAELTLIATPIIVWLQAPARAAVGTETFANPLSGPPESMLQPNTHHRSVRIAASTTQLLRKILIAIKLHFG